MSLQETTSLEAAIRGPEAPPAQEADRFTTRELADCTPSKRLIIEQHERTCDLKEHINALREERDEHKARAKRYEGASEENSALRLHEVQSRWTISVTVVAMGLAGAFIGSASTWKWGFAAGWTLIAICSAYQLGWSWIPRLVGAIWGNTNRRH